MKNILFVHQSADLYGSDKALYSLVQGIDKSKFQPIVILPEKGPLLDALLSAGISSYVVPIVRIGRSTFHPKAILSLPFQLVKSVKAINLLLKDKRISIVHSNTLAVLSGVLWAKLNKIQHIWHVHEMVTHPTVISKIFPFLLRVGSTKIICNSNATRQWILNSQPSIANKSLVIWNGVESSETVDMQRADKYREHLGIPPEAVLVVLVGRINRLKGQQLLIRAADLLWDRGLQNVYYLIVGSPPRNQEHFLKQLRSYIDTSKSRAMIIIKDFYDDIATIWQACDISVVPSTEPEGFGMVAIEAMMAQKPVVAAAHGGLTEIVVDGETGLLFDPCNASALANALSTLILDKNKRRNFGISGYRRAKNIFSFERYISDFESVYNSL